MDYKNKIKSVIDDDILSIELISETSNKVFKVVTRNNGTLFAKFYMTNSFHRDNELRLYSFADSSYLKELYYSEPDMAIFRELKGKTVDSLSKEEIHEYKDMIIDSLISFFTSVSSTKVEGYGILDEHLRGKSTSFLDFLKSKQKESAEILKDYDELNHIAEDIFAMYEDSFEGDTSLVPIDTNMKNIMITHDRRVKFIDPGEMISGPILMGYGDFLAHTNKTELGDTLIEKLNLSKEDRDMIHIYAIFSSLNILAFLKKNGVDDLYSVIPFGNSETFLSLITYSYNSLSRNQKKLSNKKD